MPDSKNVTDKGLVAYVVYNMSLGRDIARVRTAWEMLDPEHRYAWRAAAEAVLDEGYYESWTGAETDVEHHHV